MLQLLAAAPLKLPCIITPAHSQSKRAPSPPASAPPMLPSAWEISHETMVATAAVPQSATLFLTEHAKQRMRQVLRCFPPFCAHPSTPTNAMFTPPALMLFSLQRGISPSDVADAVSNGRATRSSKQNMNFQTKVQSNRRRLALGSLT